MIDLRSSILIIHNNVELAARLARAFQTRGLDAYIASDAGMGLAIAGRSPPAYAVVDLHLHDGRSAEVLRVLCSLNPEVRIVALQGFRQPRQPIHFEHSAALSVLAMVSDADEILDRLDLPPQVS